MDSPPPNSPPLSPLTLAQRLRGTLLGTAVGDALGLPREGLSPGRARRLFGATPRHCLLPGWGMVSDDTEHTHFVAEALLAAPDSPAAFARHLAWSLRLWILALPAGVGFATLRATLKLWLGFPPHRSGVFSAGNGPAMRAAPMGAYFAGYGGPDWEARLAAHVAAATRLTHTDPRALIAARAVAGIAAWTVRAGLAPVARPSVEAFLACLRHAGTLAAEWEATQATAEWEGCVREIAAASRADEAVQSLALRFGGAGGVTGYAYHTVPVAAYAWYRHFGDFPATLAAVLDCGGDTDTVGAIAGALAGTVTGPAGIPTPWIDGIRDWPRTPALLAAVAGRLAEAAPELTRAPAVPYWRIGVLPRNLVFLIVVLGHGLRRLFPPYR